MSEKGIDFLFYTLFVPCARIAHQKVETNQERGSEETSWEAVTIVQEEIQVAWAKVVEKSRSKIFFWRYNP